VVVVQWKGLEEEAGVAAFPWIAGVINMSAGRRSKWQSGSFKANGPNGNGSK